MYVCKYLTADNYTGVASAGFKTEAEAYDYIDYAMSLDNHPKLMWTHQIESPQTERADARMNQVEHPI